MQIVFGATIYTSDGRPLGTIDRLILDPEQERLTAIAIRRGHLLHYDVEVPVAELHELANGQLQISLPLAHINELPRFDEARYMPTPPGYALPAGLSSPGLLLPLGYLADVPGGHDASQRQRIVEHELEAMWSSQDLANAVIGPGSIVTSHDGVVVGKLQALTIDAESDNLTSVTIRSAIPPNAVVTLPAQAIAAIDDQVIYLRNNATWFTVWAHLEPGVEVWTSDRVCLGTLQARTINQLVINSLDGTRTTVVPMEEIDHISANRLLLKADQAKVALWSSKAVAAGA